MHPDPTPDPEPTRPRPWLLACLLVCALAACATAPEPVRLPPPRPLAADLPAMVAPAPSVDDPAEAPAVPAAATDPTGRLRLSDALAAAVLRHPDLAAASWEVRAAEARALQAGLPPNPELELEMEEFGGTDERHGVDAAELSVGLSQEILLAGKLGKRSAVARLEGELAGWDYEAARLDVLTECAKAFFEVLAAQERLALLDGSVRTNEQFLAAVAEQVRVGKVPPLDESRARVALSLQRLERDRAARDLAVRRRLLAASWGGEAPLFEAVEGALYGLRPIPAPDDVAALLAQNPDLARWAVERELHRARVDLQRAERTPDVTLFAGASHYREDGGDAFKAGIAIPLPVFDSNLGGVLEAVADRRRADEGMRAAALRVRAELFAAYQALAVSSEEAATLRDAILPTAEEAFAAADEGFRQGKFGFLDVLDAQRTLFEVRQQLVDALAGYHIAVADLERLIGQRLDGIAAHAARPEGEAK